MSQLTSKQQRKTKQWMKAEQWMKTNNGIICITLYNQEQLTINSFLTPYSTGWASTPCSPIAATATTTAAAMAIPSRLLPSMPPWPPAPQQPRLLRLLLLLLLLVVVVNDDVVQVLCPGRVIVDWEVFDGDANSYKEAAADRKTGASG
jgi:hypothetical protein